jgi:hypothetical protein
MIDFSNVVSPEVSYYEFPVWIHTDEAPINPLLTKIPGATETL